MRLRAIVYRAHNPKWSFQPESCAGAAITGGRFNPVGMPALYTSFRFQTAWLEAQQGFPFKAQPMTLCAYDVDCEDVLDLTDRQIQQQYGIDAADMSCAWQDIFSRGTTPPSWALAARLSSEMVAEIIVPSMAPGCGPDDINAVFWTWANIPPHKIRVVDDEARLPNNPTSWQ
jgi:RES domain-containing protein